MRLHVLPRNMLGVTPALRASSRRNGRFVNSTGTRALRATREECRAIGRLPTQPVKMRPTQANSARVASAVRLHPALSARLTSDVRYFTDLRTYGLAGPAGAAPAGSFLVCLT